MATLIIMSVILNLLFLFYTIWNIKRRKHEKWIHETQGRKLTHSIPITNQGLLELCIRCLDGKRCNWYDENISLDTILSITLQCKEYLLPLKHELYRIECLSDSQRALTMRQIACAVYASQLLGDKKYIHALHEFMDCIEDNGNARRELRTISMNEYALYICLLEMFISNLGRCIKKSDEKL